MCHSDTRFDHLPVIQGELMGRQVLDLEEAIAENGEGVTKNQGPFNTNLRATFQFKVCDFFYARKRKH